MIHNIYGNSYNLETFKNEHPGGSEILELTNGLYDCTPLFESYHNFANKESLKKNLKKYLIEENTYKPIYTFNKNNFYDTLTQKVINYLKDNHKITFMSYIKFIGLSLLYCYSLYKSFISMFFVNKIIFGFISGIINIMLGFCIMHDSSHYALFQKSKYNVLSSIISNCSLLWNNILWKKHHVINHHSYTGKNNKLYQDPDLLTFEPYYSKIISKSINKFSNKSKLYYFIFTSIFPGMFFGQILIYIKWIFKKHVWKMQLPQTIKFSKLDIICYLLQIYILSSLPFLSLLSYIIAQNITYSLNIIGDHDTFETYNNSINDKYKDITDWGALQVIESGNWYGSKWCFFFGGINYQIEHHLFPNIHHSHYPAISKLVKETCQEFDIPYVHHNSIINVINSYYNKIYYVNNVENNKIQ